MIILLYFSTEEAYGTETKIITMDFTGGAEIYDGLAEKLAGLDIGILGKCKLILSFEYGILLKLRSIKIRSRYRNWVKGISNCPSPPPTLP